VLLLVSLQFYKYVNVSNDRHGKTVWCVMTVCCGERSGDHTLGRGFYQLCSLREGDRLRRTVALWRLRCS